VQLTGRNLEAMTALTLMSYPFGRAPDDSAPDDSARRPVYLALAPLTHAAGVLCFPVMALGGEVVIMPSAPNMGPALGEFLALIGRHRVTHAFLPPTLIYLLLDHPALPAADLSSLQCLWYGAAPMSADRLEQAIGAFGPVLGQLFGQTEAPMMISTLAPAEHLHADGTLARERFTSAGRPTPLTTVAIMAPDGTVLPPGQRGEIVVRGPLVTPGYYKDPAATREASRYGWHHTGDVGYLDADNFLYIVDRLKDMIITGGFNVYSVEVEQALLAHPAVLDCAVVGLPDPKWGERVTAIVQLHPGREVAPDEVARFVRDRLGGVKAPKQVEIWPELPRSRVGKVLKTEIKGRLLPARDERLLAGDGSPGGAAPFGP
jgi:acyl-CoA synthetase (AMP-forming)/AMP-acid ligase II